MGSKTTGNTKQMIDVQQMTIEEWEKHCEKTKQKNIENKENKTMDTKQYTKESNFITVKAVKEWPVDQRNVVILGEGKEVKFTNEKGEIQLKAQIPVSRSDKTTMEWTLSQTAIQELAVDFGTYDTSKWVGGVVKLVVRTVGSGRETLSGVVITRPTQ